ncbi:MAG: type II secretion system protein, partial [Patescibacteria group bacterium]|nr:type II secretion system protein [Patescibacteria group bacterium]
MIFSKNKGFTLIELLVVIAVIGLLASIVLMNIQTVRAKARDKRRMQELKQLQIALEMYYNQNRSYPNTDGKWWSHCDCDDWAGKNKGVSDDNGWIPKLAPEFIASLPLDPLRGTYKGDLTGPTNDTNSCQFCYIYRSNGIDYK